MIFLICLLCHKPIRNKITWRTLFIPKKKIICDQCFFKYPVKISLSTFPLGKREALWYSLLDGTFDISPLAFSYELGELFSFVLSHHQGIVIYFDKLDYNFVEKEKLLEYISEEIIFITLFS